MQEKINIRIAMKETGKARATLVRACQLKRIAGAQLARGGVGHRQWRFTRAALQHWLDTPHFHKTGVTRRE